jgi:hypothetical protein
MLSNGNISLVQTVCESELEPRAAVLLYLTPVRVGLTRVAQWRRHGIVTTGRVLTKLRPLDCHWTDASARVAANGAGADRG